MENPFSLENKTILITGASSGIGQSIAINCAAQGAKVILLGRDIDRLEDTVKKCTNNKKNAFLSFDLMNPPEESEILHDFLKQHGPFDGLVLSAGVSPTIPFKLLNKTQILETFQLNVFSNIGLIQKLLQPNLKNPSGMSIVLISSVIGNVGEKGKALYAMTKASIIGLTKSLSVEYAKKNVRINTISPAVVNSPLSKASEFNNNEDLYLEVMKNHPLGFGEPIDIANASIYLLSNASKWVTGTNLVVDGGYLAK